MPDDDFTTPMGLLRCLGMLAEEASSLQLTRTWEALQDAMEACRLEAVGQWPLQSSALH